MIFSPEVEERIVNYANAKRILGIDNPTQAQIKSLSPAQWVEGFIDHRSRVADPRSYVVRTLDLDKGIYEIWKRFSTQSPHYISTPSTCSCPSWGWQEEHRKELAAAIGRPFYPICKHQALIAKLVPAPVRAQGKNLILWTIQDGLTYTWISRDGQTFHEYKRLATTEEWIEARNNCIRAGWRWQYTSSSLSTLLNKSTSYTKYK